MSTRTLPGRDAPAAGAAPPAASAEPGLRRYLARGAGGSFILRVAATGLSLVTSVVLARLLGASGYGAYAYAMAVVGLLSVPAASGLPPLVTRSVAAYQRRAAWALMRGLLGWASRIALTTSVGAALAAGAVMFFLVEHLPGTLTLFWLALILVPLTSFNMLRAAALQGMRRVVTAQLPEALVRPGLFIATIAALYLALGGGELTPVRAMALQVAAAAAAFLLGVKLLAGNLPAVVKAAQPAHERRAWLRSLLPLLLIGGMQVVNNHADVLMLGAIRGAEAAGIYRVATQGALLVSFGLTAANMALAPLVASLSAAGETDRLQRVITASARMVLLWSLPVALVMMLAGQFILSFLFGAEFAAGATALAILSGGQLLNAGMGSVSLLLTMSGHERETALGVSAAAVANVTLNSLFIPAWGIEGAAAATATSLVMWNVWLAVRAYRRLGVHATALGRIGRPRRP